MFARWTTHGITPPALIRRTLCKDKWKYYYYSVAYKQYMVPEEDSRLANKILNYISKKIYDVRKAPNKAPNHKS